MWADKSGLSYTSMLIDLDGSKDAMHDEHAVIRAGFIICLNLAIVSGICLTLHASPSETLKDRIDLTTGWRFRPDAENVGLEEGWHTAACSDEDWTVLAAGKRWEDQGFRDVDGYAWYRRQVEVPGSWRDKNVWLVLGGVNDACILFCNGTRINSYGDETEHSVHSTPIIAELSNILRFGESNLIAIRVYDWGASGGLWRLPCVITTDPAELPLESLVSCYPDAENRILLVDVDLTSLGNERPRTTLRVGLSRPDSRRFLAMRTIPLAPGENDASLSFDLPDAEDGAVYRVEVAAQDSRGKPFAGVAATTNVEIPEEQEWSVDQESITILNNFVTVLLSVRVKVTEPTSYTFVNPRKGWVFFSVSYDLRDVALPTPRVILDDRQQPLVWRPNPETGAFEAMQFLEEGRHQIRVQAGSTAQLDVRTISEIAFCYYPSTRHIAAFPPYDWAYMERHILPHVNTLITRSAVPEHEFEQWLSEGRQWISNASLPGLASTEAPSPQEVFDVWAQNPAVTQPGFSGMIVDEFLWSGIDHYKAWSNAVRQLHADSKFKGKTFYAWCGDLYKQQPSLEFSQLLTELNDRFSWEKYLREEPTPEKAHRLMLREMQRPFAQWRKLMPGVEQHMVMCLGYLSAPPETLNLHPSVNYHVFMDMQFQMLATDPTFWGLYGIMEYMAAYADEEAIRWAHKLFRHYCIEGNRSRLSDDPYILPHIKNPDFADGLEGWRVEPATNSSVDTKQMTGFSWLQGRYPRTTRGDRFCWMKRSGNRPNRVRQTIRSLDPGRVYSLKLISADLRQLDKKQTLALSIEIDGAERLDEHCFQFPYPSCYSHEVEPYNRSHPAYFNFHRIVFRPESATAELMISDWANADEPGGPVGQETAFNFVEVQPFLEP